MLISGTILRKACHEKANKRVSPWSKSPSFWSLSAFCWESEGPGIDQQRQSQEFLTDFRQHPLLVYGYRDKFRALPGDDPAASPAWPAPRLQPPPLPAAADPALFSAMASWTGFWDASTALDETFVFWQQVRLPNLASGPHRSDRRHPATFPRMPGGIIGIEWGGEHYVRMRELATTYLPGSYVICSRGILGKYIEQLDITMDDGNTQTGAMRAVTDRHTRGNAAVATTSIDDATTYTICMGI